MIGLVQLPDAQIAFVDTPGLHLGPKRALNRAMNRAATAAVGEADLVIFVVEALKWTDEDELALGRIASAGRAVVAVVNKVDRVRPRERLLPYMGKAGRAARFPAIVPVSATKGDNLEDLQRVIVAALAGRPRRCSRSIS